ncbi:MAG: hypothetical protein AAF843_05380 [Bacteroidota bacterium]
MKKLLLFFALLGMLTMISCSDDDEAPKLENSDSTADELAVVGTSITLTDNDIDATAFAWSATPSTGVTITENGNSADVTFSQAGDYEIVVTRTYPANFVNPTTTLTISVEVFDILTSSATAVLVNEDGSDGMVLDLTGGAVNVISTGATVRFTNTTTGSANTTDFTFEGGDPASVSNVPVGGAVDVVYGAAGNYNVTISSERTTTGVEDTNTLTLADLFTVVTPLTIVGSEVRNNNTVAFGFSKDLDASTASAADFTVDVVNFGVAANDLSINSVAVDSDSVLLITMTENFFGSDSIFVSYSGGLQDFEGLTLPDFSQEFVSQNLQFNGSFELNTFETGAEDLNILPFRQTAFYGFPQDTREGVWSMIVAGEEFTVYSPNFADVVVTSLGANDQAAFEGDNLSHFVNNLDQNNTDIETALDGNTLSFANGQEYLIKVSVFVVSADQYFNWDEAQGGGDRDDPNNFGPSSLRLFSPEFSGWGDMVIWDVTTLPTGEWTTLSTRFTASGDATGQIFWRFRGKGEIYLDDIYIVPVDPR